MTAESELEARGRDLQLVSSSDVICNACGESIARRTNYIVKATGEPWVDPFQAGGITMFVSNHPHFCKSRWRRFLRLFGITPRARTTERSIQTVNTPI